MCRHIPSRVKQRERDNHVWNEISAQSEGVGAIKHIKLFSFKVSRYKLHRSLLLMMVKLLQFTNHCVFVSSTDEANHGPQDMKLYSYPNYNINHKRFPPCFWTFPSGNHSKHKPSRTTVKNPNQQLYVNHNEKTNLNHCFPTFTAEGCNIYQTMNFIIFLWFGPPNRILTNLPRASSVCVSQPHSKYTINSESQWNTRYE